MALKIKDVGFLESSILSVDSGGVAFSDGIRSREFAFKDILYILLSKNNELCFQVGQEVFKVKMKPGNEEHEHAMKALIQEAKRTCTENS